MNDFVEIPIDESSPTFVEHVNLLQTGEKVKGGDEAAPANKQAVALTQRTAWLKAQLVQLISTGVKVVGTLANKAELDAIPTEGLAAGTGYFTEAQLWVWNTTEWIGSGSLLGPRGITLLGTWPDANQLPDVTASTIGDAYIWRSDIWLLIPGGNGTPPPEGTPAPANVWSSIGLQGPEGKSTYQSWLDTGHTGTELEFVTSLVGKSSYQSWLDTGHTGTEADFVEWQKSTEPGKEGPPGPAATPFVVAGTKSSIDQLPNPGLATEAWYIGSNLYVWVDKSSAYVDLGSVGGLSAYELALQDGFSGTLQDWLASLHSVVPGPKGDRGANLNVKGTTANSSTLALILNPVEQDGWVTADNGHLNIRIDGAWVDVGQFVGQSTYQIWVTAGHAGDENAFLTWMKGKDGTNGTNVIITGSVATFTALPASPKEQDVYAVIDINTLYGYVGGNWITLGSFRGVPGTNGTDGVNGTSINIIKILTPEDSTPPNAAGNSGNAYIDLNKRIQISNNVVWIDAGPVGAPGDKGEQGSGINLRGIVVAASQLPKTAANGDGWFTSIDKMLYVMTDGQWAGPFDITGLQGPEGPIGPQGKDGASINILDAFPTMEALAAAHPTGNLGDGYLVGNNLAIWTTADGGKWIDIGLVRGPQGIQGVRGPQGNDGKKGDKGEKGASWITLPAGQDEPSAGFTGNIGDWAVSETFKVYYKTATEGWQYWGQLVAGDVNSPQLSVGKVVRLGNQWVALPVDEAPSMIEGRLYVRQLVPGSINNQGEWVELVFPTPFDDAPADGLVYMRSRASGATKGTWTQYVPPKVIADLTDAQKDGLLYARSYATDGTTPLWKQFSLPAAGIGEAPTTAGKTYLRSGANGNWVEFTDVPTDTNLYLRKGDKTWVIYTAPVVLPDAPNDTNTYARKGGAWVSFTPGVPEVPVDNNLYLRKGNGTWSIYTAPSTISDVPNDNNLYFRKGGGSWSQYTPPTVLPEAPSDGGLYARKNGAWSAFTPGISDVPADSNLYLRKGDGSWSVYTAPTPGIADAPNDTNTYARKGGAWVAFSTVFDTYTVKIVAAAAGVLDLSAAQCFTVANSSATTISFKSGTVPAAGRAMTVVLQINGASTITWPSGIQWNGGTVPTLGSTRTMVTLFWDGTGWTGTSGATI